MRTLLRKPVSSAVGWWSLAAVLAGSLGAMAACKTPRSAVFYGQGSKLTPEDYPAVLETWTRSDRVYIGFDSKMFVTATLHAPEFRRAFAAAFPEIYGHGGNITRRELVDFSGDIEQFHTLFMAVYTPDDKWNDLDLPDSIWRVSLIGGDEVAVAPAEIIQVKIDANLRAVYPYIGRFDIGYLVRFPLTDAMKRLVIHSGTANLVLRVASALGSAEMRWDLTPSSDGPSATAFSGT